MNRLEKLKNKSWEFFRDNNKPVGNQDFYFKDNEVYFCKGFDCASAEYEKIIAELEGALDRIVIQYSEDLYDHDYNPHQNPAFSMANEALQKLNEFRG